MLRYEAFLEHGEGVSLWAFAVARLVEGCGAQEKIKGEFEDSMAKLKPLLARMEATDRLIDRVVYRLYGLTEEEITVVERKA